MEKRGMIRFARAILVAIVLVSSVAFAQTSQPVAAAPAPPPPQPAKSEPAPDPLPKVQVFGGYSLLHADNGRLNGTLLDVNLRQPNNTFGVRSNFNGWNAEAQYNVSRLLGVVADFAGYYGSPFTPYGTRPVGGLPSQNSYSVMVGPVFTYRRYKKLTPYVHALFGFSRSSLGASTITGVPNPVSSVATTYDNFAMALGGGVDYKLNRRFALRLAQAEWYHTSLNLDKYYGSAYGASVFDVGLSTNQRNLRFSAGIVVNF
jgi:opacity protein-like surface antigen